MRFRKSIAILRAPLATATLIACLLAAWPSGSAVDLGEFEPTQIIGTAPNNIQPPEVAVGDDGTAAAVWRQTEGPNVYIMATRQARGQPWTAPIRLSAYSASGPMIPHITAGPNGTFLAAWGSTSSSPTSFHYSWYHPGQGWDTPAPVSVTPGQLYNDLALCTDPMGNAFALVFEGPAAANKNVSAVRWTVGSGWGSFSLLETSPDEIEFNSYRIAADESGNAVAVWTQTESTYKSILSNRYTPATGWLGVTHLEADVNLSHQDAYVAALDQGVFVAAWVGERNVVSNTYTPGSGWSGALVIDTNTDGNAGWVRVGSLGTEALVSWSWTNSSAWEIRAATGVGALFQPRTVVTSALAASYPTLAASHAARTATVAWMQIGGDWRVARFVAGQGWSESALLYDHDTGYGLMDISAGMGDEGDAVYVWRQSSPDYIATAVRIRESVAPPLSVASPAEFAVLGNASVLVSGTTEPGAWVAANGVVAAVDEFGNFESLVPLVAGSNTISVVARDAAGNERSAARHVTFADPLAGLEADLAAAQAQLAVANAQLAALSANLSGTQGDLAAANASLAAAEAALASAQVQLAGLEANGTASGAELEAAQRLIEGLQTNLTAARADATAANARITALENRPSPAPSDGGLALALAVVAMLVAFAGLAASMMRGRSRAPAEPSPAPPPPKDGSG